MQKSRGSTLLMVMFIAIAALSMSLSMMQLASTKSMKAANDINSLRAFYAAEAGLNQAIDTLSDTTVDLATRPTPDTLGLPVQGSPATINGASYYLYFYYISDSEVVISSQGSYKGANKRIRSKIKQEIDDAFNFGLLSKDKVEIYTGNITFGLDIHGNGGLDFKGNASHYTSENNAIATQSNNPSGYSDKTSNYGIYRPSVSVPKVDFPYFQNKLATESTFTPTSDQVDLSSVYSYDNAMFTKEYLQSNTSVRLPVLSSANNIVRDTYIAKSIPNEPKQNIISMFGINKKYYDHIVNDTNSLVNSIMDNKYSKYLLCVVDNWGIVSKFIDITFTIDYNIPKYIIGAANGNGNGNGSSSTSSSSSSSTSSTSSSSSGDGDDSSSSSTSSTSSSSSSDDSNGNSNGNGNGSSSSSSTSSSSSSTSSSNGNGSGGNGAIDFYIPAGDHGGRVYYIDNKDIGAVNINLGGLVSNATIVATGDVVFCGAENGITDNGNQRALIDFVIASGGNVTHNGRLETGCFYWLDGNFRQNGQADLIDGRVMAQGTIEMHGAFELTTTKSLDDFDFIKKAFKIKSWQEIASW